MLFVDCLRLVSTFVGIVVIVLWLAGVFGLGVFVLSFQVLP